MWGGDHEVTAVENNQLIANIYRDFFPHDTVIIADAHQYLLDHYQEFDFIWSSPPCPTHSILRRLQTKKIYPDMELYQEIIFLKHWFKGKYVVENVTSYYDPLIRPQVLHRHYVWSNFPISDKEFPKLETAKHAKEKEFLQEQFGFNLDKYKGIDKRKLLRNCVVPEMGKHILDQLNIRTQK